MKNFNPENNHMYNIIFKAKKLASVYIFFYKAGVPFMCYHMSCNDCPLNKALCDYSFLHVGQSTGIYHFSVEEMYAFSVEILLNL